MRKKSQILNMQYLRLDPTDYDDKCDWRKRHSQKLGHSVFWLEKLNGCLSLR